MNFQTLIATKASRVCTAAEGDPVIEFGLRRAHGPDAAIYGARAAFEGGRTDTWGVGTKLVTAYSTPALGGVYKLTAIEESGRMVPKIKRSDNPEKMTHPGLKKIIRFFDESGQMRGDVMFLEEELLEAKPLRGYHATIPEVSKVYPLPLIRQELLVPIFQKGRLVYPLPSLKEIQKNSRRNLEQLGFEFKRFKNPPIYQVSVSRQLMKAKRDLQREAL